MENNKKTETWTKIVRFAYFPVNFLGIPTTNKLKFGKCAVVLNIKKKSNTITFNGIS